MNYDARETMFGGMLGVAGLIVLVAVVLGMGQCITYDRWRERTCMAQGGSIVEAPAPGGSRDNKGCFKVTVDMQPIAIPAR